MIVETADAVREEMTFHFVEHMDQVLAHSLVRSEDAEVAAPTGETEARLDSPPLAH